MGHVVKTRAGILNGQAADHDGSLIDHLDPRGRIMVAALFAVVVVSLSDFLALGIALAIAGIVMLLARLPFRPTLYKVMAMDGFILFLLLMLPFTTPGETVFTLGSLAATKEGVLKALTIALKANTIIMALLALVGTLEGAVLGHALYRLRVPENLVYLLLFTVRYIDVLRQEYLRLRIAMQARCFRPGNNRHTYQSIGYLVGMLLVRSLERSERILEAMKCRGFHGRFFLLDDLCYGWRDVAFISIAAIVVTVLFVLEFSHG